MSVVAKQIPRAYCCGKMRGRKWFAFPEFDAAAERLRRLGWDVANPAEIDRNCGFDAMTLPDDTDWNVLPPGLDIDEIMARDIDALESCAAIYIITDGVMTSDGARIEMANARKNGKLFLYDLMTDEELADALAKLTLKLARQDVEHGDKAASREVRITDPKTGGQKGAKPAMFDQIPAEPLWQLAELYGYGANKYAPDNWRKGYSWRLSFAACMRHLWSFWRGEDIDPESGFKHVIHAAWHCMAMAWFLDNRRSHDDRQNTLERKP